MTIEEFKNGICVLGDCIEVMSMLPAASVDAVITDPPYGTTACKWDAIIPLDQMWNRLEAVSTPRMPIVLFGSQPFSSVLVSSNFDAFRYGWIWEKSKASNFVAVKRQPLKNFEDVLIFGFQSPNYFAQKTDGDPYKPRPGKKGSTTEVLNAVPNPTFRRGSEDGKRWPKAIQYFVTAESEGNTLHPTQKPVELLRYLIRTYTEPGETVLDFTMGSGTTCVAAVLEGRKFIGIEKEQKYFDIACDRIRETETK